MWNEQTFIDLARGDTASVLARATAAAKNLDEVVDRGSEHSEQLAGLSTHLWELADAARGIEHDLAALYAEVRAAQRAEVRQPAVQETTT